jgi:hypothetical protein
MNYVPPGIHFQRADSVLAVLWCAGAVGSDAGRGLRLQAGPGGEPQMG